MGGVVPMGYRVDNRKLIIDEEEAARVRKIFERYLALRSVPKLRWSCGERECGRESACLQRAAPLEMFISRTGRLLTC
jgi:hypothetical protein